MRQTKLVINLRLKQDTCLSLCLLSFCTEKGGFISESNLKSWTLNDCKTRFINKYNPPPPGCRLRRTCNILQIIVGIEDGWSIYGHRGGFSTVSRNGSWNLEMDLCQVSRVFRFTGSWVHQLFEWDNLLVTYRLVVPTLITVPFPRELTSNRHVSFVSLTIPINP